MSRAALPLGALLALALALPAAGVPAPALSAVVQTVLVERDPAAARAFLDRTDHDALRASDAARPSRYERPT